VVATIKVQLLEINRVKIPPQSIVNQGNICSVGIPAYFDKHYVVVIRPAKSKIFDENGQCDYEIFDNINRDLSKIFDENGQCNYEKFDKIDRDLSHHIASGETIGNKYFKFKFIKNSLKRVPEQVDNSDEIANIINAVEGMVPAAPVVNNDEIANIINAVEGIVPVVDNNDEIANIINAVEGIVPVVNSDEIANIINAVEQYILGPLGSPPATSPLDKSDEIANIINAVEGISKPIDMKKIEKIIEIINRVEEYRILKIIQEIHNGKQPIIDKEDIDTLYDDFSFISHALFSNNFDMIFYLLQKEANIYIGTPSFLQIFLADPKKSFNGYPTLLDVKTEERLNKRITELEEEIKSLKDPKKIEELKNEIKELKTKINELEKKPSGTSTVGKSTVGTSTDGDGKCSNTDENIVSLGTFDSKPICYDKSKNDIII
jgi:hypothetical protein